VDVIFSLLQIPALMPFVMIAGLAAGIWAHRRDRARHAPLGDKLGRTAASYITRPLPGDISAIARLGEGQRPRETLGTTIMTTTPGLRLISLGLTLVLLGVLWNMGQTADMQAGQPRTVESQWISFVMRGFLVMGLIDMFTYDLQVNRTEMVLTRYGFWTRRFQWDDLLGIDDDRNYQYVLAFSKGGRVKLLKYLVGMPGFLKVVADVLARNEARHAGTARG
jgi:hypothetical protein